MLITFKRLIRRRKAISPIVSALLIIALVVMSVSLVYLVVIPFLSKTQLYARVVKITDTDKDSRYDQLTLSLSNTGTKQLEIIEVLVWTTPESSIGNQNAWRKHEGWNFIRESGSIVYPSDFKDEKIYSTDQIELTIEENTFYRLEITYSGQKTHFFSDWRTLNDQVDFSDLMNDFETFDLQAWGFEGTIDVPGWASNNYFTLGGPDYGPIIPNQYLYLPVPGESKWVKFYITGKIVIFHSTNGNLTNQPTFLQINRTANPFRANKFFILGLAGSWGDEFPTQATALTLKVTYTDGTVTTWNLGREYIDDWWYSSNINHSPGGRSECIAKSYGKIIEIDLGTQKDWPHERIHTHTASFILDIYKYIQYISFTDPGNDQCGPHLLSISAG